MDMDIWKPFARYSENKEKRRIFAAFFCIKPPQGGFIFAKPRLRRADSRFAEHRKFSSKVLIVAVRSCHCGVLIRGLRTSKLPAKGTFLVLFAPGKKNQKAHQRFANLWTPGTIQSSVGRNFAENSGGTCRNRFCLQNAGVKALNRCERVTVVQTQD